MGVEVDVIDAGGGFVVPVVLDPHEHLLGGMLAKKAGVTHFHVGELDERLAALREMVERFHLDPCWYYLTQVERSRKLMREAIQLASEGATCDIDTVEGELHEWVRFWLDEGGDPSRLTISSDASVSSPMKFSTEVREQFLDGSDRRVSLTGEKFEPGRIPAARGPHHRRHASWRHARRTDRTATGRGATESTADAPAAGTRATATARGRRGPRDAAAATRASGDRRRPAGRRAGRSRTRPSGRGAR